MNRVGGVLGDDHELGVAACEADLDASGAELAADLQRRLAEEVEEAEVERRAEGLDQPLGGLRSRLVADSGGVGEILLDRLDVAIELHRDCTMTSLAAVLSSHSMTFLWHEDANPHG